MEALEAAYEFVLKLAPASLPLMLLSPRARLTMVLDVASWLLDGAEVTAAEAQAVIAAKGG